MFWEQVCVFSYSVKTELQSLVQVSRNGEKKKKEMSKKHMATKKKLRLH